MTATAIMADGSASSSWTLAWTSATVAGATALVLQPHTVQPPPFAGMDYPHDPHLSLIDQGSGVLLALAVAGITVRGRFRFDLDIHAAPTNTGTGLPRELCGAEAEAGTENGDQCVDRSGERVARGTDRLEVVGGFAKPL